MYETRLHTEFQLPEIFTSPKKRKDLLYTSQNHSNWAKILKLNFLVSDTIIF